MQTLNSGKRATKPCSNWFGMVLIRIVQAAALAIFVAGCAGTPADDYRASAAHGYGDASSRLSPSADDALHGATNGVALQPRILRPSRHLQCVPFARSRSKINIYGDASTWWRAARGRYQQGRQPAVGSVLSLKRKGKSSGHLAVVTRILSDREIVVDHANWLNKGQIHIDARVYDVSHFNDWSAVRFWNIRGGHYGGSVYRPNGFIYPANLALRPTTSLINRSPYRGR